MQIKKVLSALYAQKYGWQWFLFLMLMLAGLIAVNECLNLKLEIERANHKAEVNNLRADLIEMWVHKQMLHQTINLSEYAHINPVQLLRLPLANYWGVYQATPKNLKEAWFYHAKQACLVYVFRSGETASYRFKLSNHGFDLVRSNCEINNRK